MKEEILTLDPNDIIVPQRVRKIFSEEDLEALKNNILEIGQIHPIRVRKRDDGKWELVSGERRLRACQRAGIKIKAWETTVDDELDYLLKEISENNARADFTPIERAEAVRRAHQALQAKHGKGWKVADTAKAIGKSPQYTRQMIREAELVLDEYKIPWEQARALTRRQLNQLLRQGIMPPLPKETPCKITLLHGNAFDWQALGVPRNYYHVLMTRIPLKERDFIERFWSVANQLLLKDKGLVIAWISFEAFFEHQALAKRSGFLAVYPRPFIWVRSSVGTAGYGAHLPSPGYDTAIIARRNDLVPLRMPNHSDWISMASCKGFKHISDHEQTLLGYGMLEIFAEDHWTLIDPFAKDGAYLFAAKAYGMPEICGIERQSYLYHQLKDKLEGR